MGAASQNGLTPELTGGDRLPDSDLGVHIEEGDDPWKDRGGKPGGGDTELNETLFFSGVAASDGGLVSFERSHRQFVFGAVAAADRYFRGVEDTEESIDMSLRLRSRGRISSSLWAKQQSRPYGHSLLCST